MQQDQAKRLFEAGGFFILPLDKQGTEFGIDGSLWAVKRDSFAGVKFLPPGLHLFVYSAPPSTAALQAEGLPASVSSSSGGTPFGEGITIRHGLFRFSKPREIIVRKYDTVDELVQDGSETEDITPGEEDESEIEQIEEESDTTLAIVKKLKSTSGTGIPITLSSSDSSSKIEETIISKDYLKTLDPKLAPYPFDKQAEWKRLTSLITSHTLRNVLGVDSNGDSRCDSLMSSLADENEGAPSSSSSAAQGGSASGKPRSQWGKERQVNEIDEMDKAHITDPEEAGGGDWQEDVKKGKERCIRFACFDLKRSWKAGAVGEVITRDSRDKSWLLMQVVDEQIGGSEDELLAQIQLAFVIFTQLQNFSALDSYKAYLSLMCRSISTFLPSSTGLHPTRSLPLYTKLLSEVLVTHIEHLRQEFFEQDLPGLDSFIQDELAHLRMSLRAAYRYYFPDSAHAGVSLTRGLNTQSSMPIDEDSNLSIPFRELCEAWEKLRIAAETKYRWQLGRLEPDDVTMLRQQKGRIEYNLLAEADDDDDYREEDEDAPVVVEL